MVTLASGLSLPPSPGLKTLSLHDPCVRLTHDAGGSPRGMKLFQFPKHFRHVPIIFPLAFVKQAFSFNTVRSLYSQQQTHGLRLRGHNLPFSSTLSATYPQYPPPDSVRPIKPSISRNICLQTRAPREQYQ